MFSESVHLSIFGTETEAEIRSTSKHWHVSSLVIVQQSLSVWWCKINDSLLIFDWVVYYFSRQGTDKSENIHKGNWNIVLFAQYMCSMFALQSWEEKHLSIKVKIAESEKKALLWRWMSRSQGWWSLHSRSAVLSVMSMQLQMTSYIGHIRTNSSIILNERFPNIAPPCYAYLLPNIIWC